MRVDLNADVGELGELGQDPALMRVITSANIACGFHAGGPATMRSTVALAKAHGVAVGAHPSFHDVAGFGRRELPATPREVEDLTLYQLGALAAIAAAEGVRLTHVKAHGALYNMAARQAELADALARATVAFDRSLVFVGLAGSALVRAGERAGLRVAREAFADRAYQCDGSLVPRQDAGAIIHQPQALIERAVRMVTERRVHAIDGTMVALEADTICVHGDTPDAAVLAARLRRALHAAGVEVRAFER